MKIVWVFIVLGIAVLSHQAHAISPLQEIYPGHEDFGLSFDIHSVRLADGEIQFTVKVKEGSLNFNQGYGAALSVVRSEGADRPIRSLQSKRQGNVVEITFSVTERELQNPDLSFYFTMPLPNRMPGFYGYFAFLRNYLKP